MLTDSEVEKLMGRIFDGAREGLRKSVDAHEYAKRRAEFVFHMTDWKSDLEQLAKLLKKPNGQTDDDASALVIGFLYHVVPHLNAAGRLLLDDVADPFAGGKEKRKGGKKARLVAS